MRCQSFSDRVYGDRVLFIFLLTFSGKWLVYDVDERASYCQVVNMLMLMWMGRSEAWRSRQWRGDGHLNLVGKLHWFYLLWICCTTVCTRNQPQIEPVETSNSRHLGAIKVSHSVRRTRGTRSTKQWTRTETVGVALDVVKKSQNFSTQLLWNRKKSRRYTAHAIY